MRALRSTAVAGCLAAGVLATSHARADATTGPGARLAPLDRRIVLRAPPDDPPAGAGLLVCEDRGFVMNHCSLVSAKLADPITDADGVVAETEFSVQYDFRCRGNVVHVGLVTGTNYQEFQQGAVGGWMTGLVSAGPVTTHDPDPATTRQRTFAPGCRLTVTKVTAFPSNATIHLWGVQAADEARLLSSALTLYRLGRDYASLASWGTAKLTLLHDRLVVLLEGDPENLSFKTMLETVDAAIRNAPLPVTSEELHAAGEALAQTLRGALDAEVAKGTKMLAQFDRWHLAVDRTLKDVLDSIPGT